MPAATFHGQGQHANRSTEVYIVTVDREHDIRTLMRVEGAVLTIDREWPDVAWWHQDALRMGRSIDRVTLEGTLGDPMRYTGPLPGERAEVEPTRRAIEGVAPIALGPGR